MAPRDIRTRLTSRAARCGVSLTPELVQGLTEFYSLLSRWNEKINLTSLENPDEAIDRLLLEPLVAARFVPVGASALVDVGSGGGSPAIPMKLAIPRLSLTMVEVKARKAAFLREAVRRLGLEQATVETAHVEELLTRPSLHERFDVVSVRAVRIEPRILRTLQAFLRPEGLVFLFRGPSGPEVPVTVVPPLAFVQTHPLLDTLRSRLTILRKIPVP